MALTEDQKRSLTPVERDEYGTEVLPVVEHTISGDFIAELKREGAADDLIRAAENTRKRATKRVRTRALLLIALMLTFVVAAAGVAVALSDNLIVQVVVVATSGVAAVVAVESLRHKT